MSTKDNIGHNHETKDHHGHQSKSKRLHRDWRAWVVVVLMLAAMGAYVLSDDEALTPDGGVQQPMPAAAGV